MTQDTINAVLIIGIFTVIFGVCLYIPVYFWAKWGEQKNPNIGKYKFTKIGFLVFCIWLVSLLIGTGASYFAGLSLLGQVITIFLIGFAFIPIHISLHSRGLMIQKESVDDV